MKVELILLPLIFLISSCVVQKDPCTRGCGITGRVYWLEGNLMPAPERGRHPEKVPAKRLVVIRDLTSTDEVNTSDAPLFTELSSREVAKVWTDASGYFKICLAPGIYSVFTKEEQGYFANRFDDKGQIQAVEVEKGRFTDMTIDIDYKAYY